MATGPASRDDTAVGNLVCGRYRITSDDLTADGRYTAVDTAGLTGELDLALWPLAPGAWPAEAARFGRLLALAHPSLDALTDFGRVDDEDAAFAAAPVISGRSLETSLTAREVTADTVIAAAAPIADALAQSGLPPVSLEPDLIRVAGGAIRIAALDAARPRASPPTGAARLARTLLDSGTASAELRRVLERWAKAPGPSPTQMMSDLGRLRRLAMPPWATIKEPEVSGLESRLRDLGEAGRGSVAVVDVSRHGDLVQHFRRSVRREAISLIELGGRDELALLAALCQQLLRFAPTAFMWRHGAALDSITSGVASAEPVSKAVLRVARHAAAKLVHTVSATRPLVIHIHDADAASEDTIAGLEPIVTAAARESWNFSCLLLLETTARAEAASALGQLVARLRDADGLHTFATDDADRPPRPEAKASIDSAGRDALRALTALGGRATLAALRSVAGGDDIETTVKALVAAHLITSRNDDGAESFVLAERAGPLAALTDLGAEALADLRLRAARALARSADTTAALALLAQLEDTAEVLLCRAHLYLVRGDADATLELLDDAIALDAPGAGLPARRAMYRASALVLSGALEASWREALSARDLVRGKGGDAAATGDIERTLATIARARGDLKAAEIHVTAASRDLPPEASTLCVAGDVAASRGLTERATARYREALSLAAANGDLLDEAIAQLGLGATLVAAGQARDAERALSRSIQLYERAGNRAATARARSALASAALGEGDHDRARELIEAARRLAREARSPATVDETLLVLATIENDAGDVARCLELLRAVLERADERGDRLTAIRARIELAMALNDDGDAATAASEAERARDEARTLGARGLEATARHALAVGLATSDAPGDRTQAVRHFEAALRHFDRNGDDREAQRTLARVSSSLKAQPSLPVGRTLRARASDALSAADGDTKTVASGDSEIDSRNLELLAEALTELAHAADTPSLASRREAALGRMATATDADWAALVAAEPTAEDPADAEAAAAPTRTPTAALTAVQPLAVYGDPPPKLLAAASARARAASERRSVFRVHPSPRATVHCVALPIEGNGKPLALALLGTRRRELGAPLGIVAALSHALVATLPTADPSRLTTPAGAADSFAGIVGRTPAMCPVFSLIERIAGNELPVLLQGESGTGKELVARAIHSLSPRAKRPFVPIDCAAIPVSLIESELFGHRKGAFTGTVNDRKGLFEEAAEGTVFLDEVTNIPAPVQAKLLRVLQEREVRRVGDTAVRPIDVRMVAASNRPLEQAVADGSFREDLFFRLNVIEITLPPLRDRMDDVPLLVEHFLARLATPTPPIERAASERLLTYAWPGNVRELENELRRAYALSRGDLIRERDLSERVRAASGIKQKEEPTLPRLRDAVQDLERALLTRALEATGYHRARTAELLGLSHQGLLNKIRKYRIRIAKKG